MTLLFKLGFLLSSKCGCMYFTMKNYSMSHSVLINKIQQYKTSIHSWFLLQRLTFFFKNSSVCNGAQKCLEVGFFPTSLLDNIIGIKSSMYCVKQCVKMNHLYGQGVLFTDLKVMAGKNHSCKKIKRKRKK